MTKVSSWTIQLSIFLCFNKIQHIVIYITNMIVNNGISECIHTCLWRSSLSISDNTHPTLPSPPHTKIRNWSNFWNSLNLKKNIKVVYYYIQSEQIISYTKSDLNMSVHLYFIHYFKLLATRHIEMREYFRRAELIKCLLCQNNC